jgi:hypothetical protein
MPKPVPTKDEINQMVAEALNPQGHCVGCGRGLVDRTVKFTPNALPVCSEYCGTKAELWLYPRNPWMRTDQIEPE